MPTLQVSLTRQLEQLVQEKVDSGMFRDASDVVCEALRNLDANKKLAEELLCLRFGEQLKLGIDQARQNQFSEKSFDEIIAEAESEDNG